MACQTAGNATFNPPLRPAAPAAAPLLVEPAHILGVQQTSRSDEIALTFAPGVTAAAARAIGRQYGVELIGGPLISGPLLDGRYIFKIPEVSVVHLTPTTASVHFPSVTKPSDRIAYLFEHHMQLIRWVREKDPEEDTKVAIVRMTAERLNPTMLDPVAGIFRVTLAAELDRETVSDWAKSAGMQLIKYDPADGSTLLHPSNWQPIAPRPVAYYQASRQPNVAPVAAPSGRLYVQFIRSTSAGTIEALVGKLGLQLVNIGATNFAVLSGDPASFKAAIQLLSDNANVQCVGPTADPCAAPANPPSPIVVSRPPTYGQPSSVSVRVVEGILVVSWQAAAGASAYAIFRAAAPSGPYELVGIVDGQDRTSVGAFDQSAPGATVHYQVVALHPCTQIVDASCDVTPVPFGGVGTRAAAWANPVVQAIPSPSPSPAIKAVPSSSPTAGPAKAFASPSPVTAIAPSSSPTATVQTSAQTRLGPNPMGASAGVSAAAADGHVTVSWQPVPGASQYRVYRSIAGGAAAYIATTSELLFTDTGGTAGTTYAYRVAGVAGSGLVGRMSNVANVTWQASTAAPVVLRSLPAEAGVLSGRIQFQLDARGGDGRGTVQWQLRGAAASLTIGTASGLPSAVAPLSWSADLIWDSSVVPDGTYTVTAIVTGTSGQQTKMSTIYRVQNSAAPIAPINLAATAQAGGVALTWQQAASVTGAYYNLFRDQPVSGSPLTQISADKRSLVDTSVQPGRHQYELVLVSAQGKASQPARAEVVVGTPVSTPLEAAPDLQLLLPTGQPLAPGGRVTDRVLLIASAMSDLTFQLSTDGRTWGALPQSVSCAQDVCTLDLRMEGLTYGPHSVRAATPRGVSHERSFVRARATRYHAPAAMSAQLTGLGVELSWTAPASARPSSYHVARRVAGGDWELLDQVARTTYIDSEPPVGRSSEYRVSAIDPEGEEGQPSMPVSVSIPLTTLADVQVHGPTAAPTHVQVHMAQGRATVQWEAVVASDGYLVERQLEAGGAFAAAGKAGGESFVDSPALAARQVSYRVVSLNGATEGAPSPVATTLVVPTAPPTPVVDVALTSSRPEAPATLTAATEPGAVRLKWTPAAGSAPSSTFSVYRFDPVTGAFGLAAAGLASSSFTDAALPSPARFGYVVTASSASGLESAFSEPVWLAVTSGSTTLNVDLVAPSSLDASLVEAEALQAIARVTAAVGLDQISFAIAPAGGLWKELIAVPTDPFQPLPTPEVGAGLAALWGTAFNTTSLAPGGYKLRVQVRDRAGHSQEKVQDLYVVGPTSRGPPSFELKTSSIPGGVHIAWSDVNPGGFLVRRSLFGPSGPFETVATVRSQHYDDLLTIPFQAYAYQVVGLGSNVRHSVVATATSGGGPASTGGGPSVHLGPVSQTELAIAIAVAPANHSLMSGLRALGGAYEIDAKSLATARQVHQLGQEGQVTFALPPGLSADEARSASIYHWDQSSSAWVKETSEVDPTLSSVTATITHLSQFVAALAPPPAGGGSLAQPPAPVVDSPRVQSQDPSLRLPPPVPQLQADANGEVVSLRTANRYVYKKAGGSLQQVVSTGLVNYRDATGMWQKIDGTLVLNSAGLSGVHNRANSFSVDLPGTMNERSVSVTSGSAAIKMALVGAAAAPLVASGSHAVYAAALSGVDVNYDVIPRGLKESLIINLRPSTTVAFAFDLNTGSLVLRQQPNGSILAVDAAGQTQLTIEKPWMHDAPTQSNVLGITSNLVAVTLTGGSGSYRLVYNPDLVWLSDPARRYPVTIDPSLTANYGNGNEYDDQINSYAPNFNYAGYNYLPIGYTYFSSPCCASAPSRAMVQFSGFIGDGVWPSWAGLYLNQSTNYGTQRGNCCTLINALAASSAWSYTGVNWNNQPAATSAYGYGQASTLGGAGLVGWDVTTLVRSWESHALVNNGFVMYTPNGENGPYNNNELFWGGVSGSGPYLTVNYDTYGYQSSVALPTKNGVNVLPNGGTTPVEVALRNAGTATWGTDTQLNYRWWSGGVAITGWQFAQYVPYSVPSGTWISLRFNLVAPSLTTTGPVYLQLALRTNAFWFSSLSWGSPSYACDQFYNSSAISCTGGTAITLVDESGTIAWQGPSQMVSAVAGSLLSIPITVTNTSTTSGRNYTWRAYNAADLIRVGIRDYRNASGNVIAISNLPNLRTYLPADVAPQGSTSFNTVIQAPGEPGDYLLRVDLVHETPTSTVWFADQGNQPLEVRARILAPGDDKTTHVPVPLGDGSSLAISTSNGFANLTATDVNIPERGGASLHVSRVFNGVNGLLPTTGTTANNSAYGAGWTFDFQRSVRLGALGPNTYSPGAGILTDARGKAWTLSWNAGRGLYEDAAGNRTIAPSTATVVSAIGNLSVPSRPVDLINPSPAGNSDSTAPGGYAIIMEGTSGPPASLIMPPGLVPVQQNGSIQFWFKPNFDMSTDGACHVFFADAQMRFGLAWNCSSASYSWGSSVARGIDFFTYNADTSSYDILSSAAITWTAASGWHHISVTWTEGGAKQLMTDTTLVSNAAHAQSPIADLFFGYQPNAIGTALNYLNGRIAQLRIDGRVVPGTATSGELWQDAQPLATLSATPNTLYLGPYAASSPQSSATTYLLRNADQSTETYSALGTLQNEADRFGNQIDYSWNGNTLVRISDHSIPGRGINFAYNPASFVATDLAGRTVTYQLSAGGDLTSVTRSNQVPDPRTGVISARNATTTYSYAAGHLLQQVTDPRGAKTILNYEQSYRPTVMADQPAAYWRLGETTGSTAADATGNYPGTIVGGVTLGSGGALWNDPDLSFKFDGVTGYIQASPVSSLVGLLTLEGWVNHMGAAWSTSYEMVASIYLAATYLSVFNGVIFLSVQIGGIQRTLAGGSVPAVGWHHLSGTWDGTYLRVYLDGSLSATSAALSGSTSASSGNALIGTYDKATFFFKGLLDEIAIFPSALSSTRIQAHYLAGRLGASIVGTYAASVILDTPVGYWRLAESAGSRAFDQSGAGSTATYNGGYALGQSGALPLPNGAVSLTGTGYVLTANLLAMFPTSSVSIEAWFNARGPGVLVDELGQPTLNSGWHDSQIELVDVGGGLAEVRVAVYAMAFMALGRVPYNTWNHVVLRFNGSVLDGFLNGIQSPTRAGTRSVPTALYYALGGTDTTNLGSGAYFNGLVDEVAIYSVALPNGRILAHYQAGRSPPLQTNSYASAILSDSPRGYWRLGEITGSAAGDSSAYGNSGTYGGGFTLGQPGALANDPNYSTRFDGISANVLVPVPANASLYLGAVVTIEAWIDKMSQVVAPIVEYNNGTTPGVHFWNFPTWDALFINLVDTAGVNHTLQSPAGTFTTNAWYHVAAVYDGAYGTLYVNGIQVARANLGSFVPQTSNYPLYIGKRPSGTPLNYFTGLIGEVAVYAAALNSARILAHYRTSRVGPTAPTGWTPGTYVASVSADQPLGYWRLNETAGPAAQDRSGFSNAATFSATGVTLGLPGALTTESSTAVGFNGSNGYAKTAGVPLAAIDNWTLEGWINPATLSQATAANGAVMAVMTSNPATPNAGYGFGIGGGSGWGPPGELWVLYEQITWQDTGYALPTANTWYHIAAERRNGTLYFYVNGIQVYGGLTTAPLAPNGLTIGADGTSISRFFNGSIADVAIYNYALNPSRLLAHYNAGRDFTLRRVASVQDARGTTIASFTYNDDAATTQVIDGRGLAAYYTFQQYGGRTLSVTDTGNNVTRYEYDGGAAYRLLATVSPSGIRQSRWVNSGALVGQQEQVLMSDVSAQPTTVLPILMAGGYPDPGASPVATEAWIWDSALTLQPGVASHRSTPGVVGLHQHSVTFPSGWMLPAGARVTQWVYLEPGVQLPGNLMVQFSAADTTGWAHRAFWGTFNLQPDTGTSCPSYCYQGATPVAGRWVALVVALGPTEGASPVVDLDMAGRTMNGVGFGAVGGTGAVWWGPTVLEFPGPNVTDPTRTVTRSAYNSTNDEIASLDPNGIATILDVDASGLTRVSSNGVEPSAPALLFADNVSVLGAGGWTQEFGYAGTSAGAVITPQHTQVGTTTAVGSVNQTHTGSGLQSDIYKDVTGLSPGTYIRVSVWVQTSGGASGSGGALLMVENRLVAPLGVQRRSASVQTPGQWAQLTLPFMVDVSGQVRIHLWHENLLGTTTWADLRIEDLTPAPDVTLQHPLAVYASGFEDSTDRAAWTLGSAVALNDPTQAHSGLWSIKDTLGASTTTNTVTRTLSLSASATYRVSAWVRTVSSGGNGGTGGAQICAQFAGSNCYPVATPYVRSEGQWQQISVTVIGSGTLTIQLSHANWQGDIYWDDVNVERVADQTSATSGTWRGTSWVGPVAVGASATWASSWSGGLAGGPSRQVTITSPGATTDISDTLGTAPLRTNASYILSVWASSTVANTSITLGVSGQNLDFAPACVLLTIPTLCQNSFTYTGADKTSSNFLIYYGGQGARTVTISHPLVALASQRKDYTQYGQLTRTYDLFGHESRIDYNSLSLYPIDTAQLLGLAGASNYRAAVLADAPIGYWRLGDSGAGTAAADSSVNNSAGTISGNVTKGLTGALPGDSNTSMGFDGSSGTITVNLPTINTAAGSQVTVELWMNWLGPTSYGPMPFGFNAYDLYLLGPGFGFNTANGDIYGAPLSAIPLNAWVHIAAVFTNGNVAQNLLYINGVQQSLSQRLGTPLARSVTTQATISGWPVDRNPMFNGRLGEVAVYNGALSSTRIQAHYQTGVAARPQPPNYRTEVLADAPKAYWRLDELAGMVAGDQSGNNNTGTISGGVTMGVTGALAGDLDAAMGFDGVGGTIAVNVPGVNTVSGSQVTVELWMYWLGGSTVQIPLGFFGYDLIFWPGTGFGFNTGNGDLYGVAISAIASNAWTHVVAVFTNGGIAQNQLYLNGVQQSLSQLVATPLVRTVTAQASISGWSLGPGYAFNGRLDEVAVYNGALTASRISTHYQTGIAARPQPPNYAAEVMVDAPSSYWRLDETGTGTTVGDLSGNNNIGTLSGAVTKGITGALPGDTDTAMSLTGGNIQINSLAPTVPFSLETWVNGTTWDLILNAAVSWGGNSNYANGLGASSSGRADFRLAFGTVNGLVVQSPAALSANAWHHMVGTFDGTVARLYVDGALVASGTAPAGAFTISSNGYLGAYQPNTALYNWNGSLDEVAVYNSVLSPARISAHYQAGIAVRPQALPALLTTYIYNAVGQQVASSRLAGGTAISERRELDSWGRLTAALANWVPGVAADSQTNVRSGRAYDLNGNLTDAYSPAQTSGAWIDTRYMYDANNNQVAQIQNCVSVTNACDGVSNAAQNVVTTAAYDALNNLTDIYAPMPGCAPTTASCVPVPTCVAANCALPAVPCPSATCVDTRTVYDTTGRVAQQIFNYGGSQDVSQANVTTQYAYDADGRVVDVLIPITSATLQSGQIDQHKTYDAQGRLASDTKAYAVPNWMPATTPARTDYTLDAGGRIVSVLGPGTGSSASTNRILTTKDYDAMDRPLSVTMDYGTGTGNLNAVTSTVYDPRGAVRTRSPPTQAQTTGMQTTTNFDLAGRVVSVVRDDGYTGLQLATSTLYDGFGRATDVIDPRGIDTNTAYDALNRAATVTQNYCPAGNTNPNCTGSGVLADQNLGTSLVYDLAGNRTQVINPRTIIQYTAYDAMARPVSLTKNCQVVPAPPSTSCGTQGSDVNVNSSQTYDQLGDVVTTTDPISRVNVYSYDALGRRVSQTLNCVGTGGQCNGGVTSGQNLLTTWQVDAQGDMLQVRSPRQCAISAPCYQGATNTSLTDGASLATGYTYDGLLRLTSVIEDQSSAAGHLNLVTSYTYDPSGNQLSRVDGRTFATTYTVDNLGRVAKVADANNNVVQTNYSLAGEVVSTINARLKTNSNTLDHLGRLTGVSYFKADGTSVLTRSFGYDADSNLTSFSDTDVAQSTVTYDHLNRVSTVTAPAPSGTTSYSYFLDGGLSSVADPSGTTSFTEDNLGRIAAMADPINVSATSYTFDAAGRLTGRTEANGIVTTATFTGADQLASKSEVSGTTTLASWTNVAYDLAQNRSAETLSYYAGNPYPDAQAGTATYQYDSMNRLSQSAIPSRATAGYGFDAAHNLTSNAGTAQAYNNNESLQTVGAAVIGADADGNQQKDVAGNLLSWNSLSQLEQFATSETFIYDALGRLAKVTNGANVTQFVYRGLSGQVVAELDGTGAVIRGYVWDSMGRQLYVKAGANVYYEITNPHGDVVALASAAALAGTVHFDAWGNLLSSAGTAIPYGFQGSAGSWTDATSGFVNMGARWYYPKVGRFLSSDPAAGTANPRTPMAGLRWLYGIDNPLRYGDPTGLRVMIDDGGGSTVCDQCQAAVAPATEPASYQAPTRAPPRRPSGPNFLQRIGNAWNAAIQVANIRPDAGGVQDNLIALGNSMDSGWKARYRAALAATGKEIGRERDALMSGDLKQWATVPAVDTLAIGLGILGCVAACPALAAIAGPAIGDALLTVGARTAVAVIPRIPYFAALGTATLKGFSGDISPDVGPGVWGPSFERMSARAAAYQSQVTGRSVDMAYWVNGVKFDTYDSIRRMLVDAKGPRYEYLLNQTWSRTQQELVDGAKRQLGAANGIAIEWQVAERGAARLMQQFISGIDIRWVPPNV